MRINIDDTIAGIATAQGESGIAIIRISGDKAINIAEKIFKFSNETKITQVQNQKMSYGWVVDDGKIIDESFLCLMRAPHSFTSEDIIEIHCHGGNFVSHLVLELTIKNGARLARAGEFTQRAFLNGRIDLSKAEAIYDIIHAKNKIGLEIAVNQLKGKLFDKINSLKKEIIWILSLINSAIEFSEEDISLPQLNEITLKTIKVINELEGIIGSADKGMQLKNGFQIVLAGDPNVGKSSILNGILGTQRAIVTELPGTTRDTIQESFILEGISVAITDTAGIRETKDIIEQKGIERTIKALKKADLILWVIDLKNPDFDLSWLKNIDKNNTKIIIVYNKSDLVSKQETKKIQTVESFPTIMISALKNDDLDKLKKTIHKFIMGENKFQIEDAFITNLRQKNSAESALEFLESVLNSINNNLGEEIIAQDLGFGLSALDEITGETTADDIINNIFDNFCIGK